MRRIILAAALAAVLATACGGDGGGAADGPDAAPDPDVVGADTVDVQADADVEEPRACPPASPAPGTVRARTLGCEADLPEGLLVAGRPGDVVLENALARFVVRTGAEGHALMGLTGGNVVDAVRLDEDGAQVGGDGLREYAMTADFHLLAPDEVRVLDDGTEGVARVRVTGELKPFVTVMEAFPVSLDASAIAMETEYVLRPDEPVLELRSRFFAADGGPAVTVTAWDLVFWGGELRPFLPGHEGVELPSAGFAPVLGVTATGRGVDLPDYATAADVSRQFLNLGPIKGFNFDPVDADAEGGEVIRWLAVGGADDHGLAGALAAVSERVDAPLQPVSGTVEGMWPGVVVEARDDGGAPVSRCRPDADGVFACRVPDDAADLVAVWLGEGRGDVGGTLASGAEVPAGEDVALQAPEPATLSLRVTDGEAGPVPFRLTGRRDVGGEEVEHRLVDGDGEATFLLPPGDWEIWVTHGPRHAWHHEALSLAAGEEVSRDVSLPRVVDAPGWIAADLHVHTEQSPDSDLPVARRLVGVLAEDLDYLVATEHDFVADHGPWIGRAGVAGRLVVRSGVEASTMRLGHFNVWPLEADPDLSGQGAPGWHGAEMEDLFDVLGEGTGPLVQCNHPRFGSGYEAFFDALGLDADTPPGLLRCDLLELVNGGRPHTDTPQVLADWSGLLDRGIRITATGTSDTHRADEPVGYARTLVHLGDLADGFHAAAPEDAAAAVEEALRAGRAVATAGPHLTVTLVTSDGREAGVGETLADPGDEVTAVVEIQAPEWMPLGTVEVLVDGQSVRVEDVSGVAPEDGRRHAVVEVPVEVAGADRWVVAWHRDAPAATPGAPRPPWAVTNPVLVDGDGDGAWTGRADMP